MIKYIFAIYFFFFLEKNMFSKSNLILFFNFAILFENKYFWYNFVATRRSWHLLKKNKKKLYLLILVKKINMFLCYINFVLYYFANFFKKFYTKINVISYNFEPIIRFAYIFIKMPRNSWIIAVSNLKYQTNFKKIWTFEAKNIFYYNNFFILLFCKIFIDFWRNKNSKFN